MFHSDIKNIKKEEVKFQPRNSFANKLTPSSSATVLSSSNKYPSLDELCKKETKDVFTSTPIFELAYINRFVKQLLFYDI